MQPPIFSQFGMIRIINLVHRTDRRREMEGELARVGLSGDPRIAFFEACRFDDAGPFSSPGARGVFASQLAILEEAAAAGKAVLILEDDADFARAAQDYCPPRDWGIFYGGYEAETPDDLQNSDIVGAHMMGFKPDIAAHLVGWLRTLDYQGQHPPIDGAYVWYRRAFPDVPTLFAEPPLAHQRPSRTDIAEPNRLDRIGILGPALGLARKLKRRLLRR